MQEERKDALGARVKQAKRDRTKSRKVRMNASSQAQARTTSDNEVGQVRKGVTFA